MSADRHSTLLKECKAPGSITVTLTKSPSTGHHKSLQIFVTNDGFYDARNGFADEVTNEND
jgi:hypothetical protein